MCSIIWGSFGAIIGFLVKYYISRHTFLHLPHLPSGLGVITGGSHKIMLLSEDSSPVYQLVRAVHQKPEIRRHRLQECSRETVLINWTYCDLLSSNSPGGVSELEWVWHNENLLDVPRDQQWIELHDGAHSQHSTIFTINQISVVIITKCFLPTETSDFELYWLHSLIISYQNKNILSALAMFQLRLKYTDLGTTSNTKD